MKKKILGIFIVVVLMVCLFFVGSAVILFMAPGVELFGIRYIQDGESEFSSAEYLDDLSGDSIYIDTHGVPININYTTYYTSKVSFRQDFVGFTKCGYDKASLKVYLDEDNNIHIETKELIKWVYAYQNPESYVLNLDLSKVYAMDKNLYITSNHSNVSINGGATYDDIEIKTEGALNVSNGAITAINFKYHTNKMINIDGSVVSSNYDLKSTGSSINVSTAITGNLVAETKGGDVKFVSCENLKVKTGGGSVKSHQEGFNCVNGSTNIVTDGGDITLGNISVADNYALCNIQSTSGDVNISTMFDGMINASRGDVNIGKARALIVNTKIGDINIDTATNQIIVNGRNGDVNIGEQGYVENAKVTPTTGTINVKNAYGDINLNSESGSVKFHNSGSEKITIKSGRNLTATGLKGLVDIYSNGDIDVAFSGVTDNVVIETGSKSNKVVVDAGKTTYLDVDYNIYATKGKNAQVWIGGKLDKEGNNINTGTHEGKKLIKIKTSYANVVLKLAV